MIVEEGEEREKDCHVSDRKTELGRVSEVTRAQGKRDVIVRSFVGIRKD